MGGITLADSRVIIFAQGIINSQFGPVVLRSVS